MTFGGRTVSHLVIQSFSCCGSGLEVRLGCQQRHRFGRKGSRRRRLGRAGAYLRPLVRVFGKLLDPRLQRGRELRSRGGLLAQVPHGPVGVQVEGLWSGGRGRQGEGEGEGRAGEGRVSGYAAVQELGQLQALQDGLADGETLGVALEDERRFLGGSGSPVRLTQLLLTPLPSKETTQLKLQKC